MIPDARPIDESAQGQIKVSLANTFVITWSIGFVGYLLIIGFGFIRLNRYLKHCPTVDEGPVNVALERCWVAIGIDRSPDLKVVDKLIGPCLFGVWRPCILISKKVVETASESDLEVVLSHELMHLRRKDILVGWIQVIVQAVFWFHPSIWWANRQINQAREEICDEAVLQSGKIEPISYGNAMLKVLASSRCQAWTEKGLVGVFESGTNLQKRLEKIMEFKTGKRFGWFSKMLVFLCAMLLPLAPTLKKEVVAQEKEIKSQPHYPQIVKTVPAMNATGVEAGNTTLRIEFDRKMSDGMSVTGDLSLLPEVIQGKQPHWENARTLLIPVKLEKNKFYRLGINSKSNQNFKSADGVSVPPAVLCFVTEGASDKKKAMVETPTVVKFDPANGAENVAVSVDSLSVTFSKAMNGDMSWVGGGPNFPKIPDGEKATWSKDGKTCHLPVALETGKSYQIGINNLNYNGFQSKAGVPVSPVIYRFSTKK